MTLTVDAWSTTAASNTSISGINIAENCAAANMNDAQRANMAAIAELWAYIQASFAKLGVNVDITGLNTGVALTESGTVSATTLGFRGIPQLSKTASYTLALTDAGKHITTTTGGIVIPANGSVAFPIGTAVLIYNDSASSQTISITTDTLSFVGNGSTGSRTLAGYGLASLLKLTATKWLISGSGVS